MSLVDFVSAGGGLYFALLLHERGVDIIACSDSSGSTGQRLVQTISTRFATSASWSLRTLHLCVLEESVLRIYCCTSDLALSPMWIEWKEIMVPSRYLSRDVSFSFPLFLMNLQGSLSVLDVQEGTFQTILIASDSSERIGDVASTAKAIRGATISYGCGFVATTEHWLGNVVLRVTDVSGLSEVSESGSVISLSATAELAHAGAHATRMAEDVVTLAWRPFLSANGEMLLTVDHYTGSVRIWLASYGKEPAVVTAALNAAAAAGVRAERSGSLCVPTPPEIQLLLDISTALSLATSVPLSGGVCWVQQGQATPTETVFLSEHVDGGCVAKGSFEDQQPQYKHLATTSSSRSHSSSGHSATAASTAWLAIFSPSRVTSSSASSSPPRDSKEAIAAEQEAWQPSQWSMQLICLHKNSTSHTHDVSLRGRALHVPFFVAKRSIHRGISTGGKQLGYVCATGLAVFARFANANNDRPVTATMLACVAKSSRCRDTYFLALSCLCSKRKNGFLLAPQWSFDAFANESSRLLAASNNNNDAELQPPVVSSSDHSYTFSSQRPCSDDQGEVAVLFQQLCRSGRFARVVPLCTAREDSLDLSLNIWASKLCELQKRKENSDNLTKHASSSLALKVSVKSKTLAQRKKIPTIFCSSSSSLSTSVPRGLVDLGSFEDEGAYASSCSSNETECLRSLLLPARFLLSEGEVEGSLDTLLVLLQRSKGEAEQRFRICVWRRQYIQLSASASASSNNTNHASQAKMQEDRKSGTSPLPFSADKASSQAQYILDITPHAEFGLGLRLAVVAGAIVVDSFKRNPVDDALLVAEACGLVNVGDELLAVNGKDLRGSSLNDTIRIIRGVVQTSNGEALKLSLKKPTPISQEEHDRHVATTSSSQFLAHTASQASLDCLFMPSDQMSWQPVGKLELGSNVLSADLHVTRGNKLVVMTLTSAATSSYGFLSPPSASPPLFLVSEFAAAMIPSLSESDSSSPFFHFSLLERAREEWSTNTSKEEELVPRPGRMTFELQAWPDVEDENAVNATLVVTPLVFASDGKPVVASPVSVLSRVVSLSTWRVDKSINRIVVRGGGDTSLTDTSSPAAACHWSLLTLPFEYGLKRFILQGSFVSCPSFVLLVELGEDKGTERLLNNTTCSLVVQAFRLEALENSVASPFVTSDDSSILPLSGDVRGARWVNKDTFLLMASSGSLFIQRRLLDDSLANKNNKGVLWEPIALESQGGAQPTQGALIPLFKISEISSLERQHACLADFFSTSSGPSLTWFNPLRLVLHLFNALGSDAPSLSTKSCDGARFDFLFESIERFSVFTNSIVDECPCTSDLLIALAEKKGKDFFFSLLDSKTLPPASVSGALQQQQQQQKQQQLKEAETFTPLLVVLVHVLGRWSTWTGEVNADPASGAGKVSSVNTSMSLGDEFALAMNRYDLDSWSRGALFISQFQSLIEELQMPEPVAAAREEKHSTLKNSDFDAGSSSLYEEEVSSSSSSSNGQCVRIRSSIVAYALVSTSQRQMLQAIIGAPAWEYFRVDDDKLQAVVPVIRGIAGAEDEEAAHVTKKLGSLAGTINGKKSVKTSLLQFGQLWRGRMEAGRASSGDGYDVLNELNANLVGLWLHDLTPLFEHIGTAALQQFRHHKDSMKIFLELVLAGKLDKLEQLARTDRNVMGKQLLTLLALDFKSKHGRNVLRKNAFALMRLQRYKHAAAVFLCADPPMLKEACGIVCKQLNDPLLAFLIARLVEQRGGPGAKKGGLVLGPDARRVAMDYVIPEMLKAIEGEEGDSGNVTTPSSPHGVAEGMDQATLALVAAMWLQDTSLFHSILTRCLARGRGLFAVKHEHGGGAVAAEASNAMGVIAMFAWLLARGKKLVPAPALASLFCHFNSFLEDFSLEHEQLEAVALLLRLSKKWSSHSYNAFDEYCRTCLSAWRANKLVVEAQRAAARVAKAQRDSDEDSGDEEKEEVDAVDLDVQRALKNLATTRETTTPSQQEAVAAAPITRNGFNLAHSGFGGLKTAPPPPPPDDFDFAF